MAGLNAISGGSKRGDKPTPHELRVAQMTTRERLIFRLIRRVAFLLGKGKSFDAECDRIASLTESEAKHDIQLKLDHIRETYGRS